MSEATQTVVNQLGYNPEVAPYLRENMAQARALTYNYKQTPALDAAGRPIIGADGQPVLTNLLGADKLPVIESFKDLEQYGGQATVIGTDGKPVQVPVLDAAGKPVIGADGKPVTRDKTEFKAYDRLAGLSDLQKVAIQGAKDMAAPKYDTAGNYIPTANENAQALALQATKALGDASYQSPVLNAAGIPVIGADGKPVTRTGNKYASAYTAPLSFGYTPDTYGGAGAGTTTDATSGSYTADTYGGAGAGSATDAIADTADAATLDKTKIPTASGQTTDYKAGVVDPKTGIRSLQRFQMSDPDQVSTASFIDKGTAGSYMSPYIQNVVDIQQRKAQELADIAATQQQGAATKSGAFGGGRDAIMRAQAAKELALQKGDIQAQGLQAAYQQAQQQFNAEQGYGLQGQIANQQAGLTQGQQNLGANLGVQQLDTQTGLQTSLANLSNLQQAELANKALAGQYGLTQAQMDQQANMQTSAQKQQAAIQNAAAKNQMAQYNAGNIQQASLAGADAKNQAAQLKATASNQAQLANKAAENQMAQYNASNLQQAGLAAAAAKNQALQFGADQKLTSAGLAAQYGQAANQLTEQSGQFGANLGLQGDQAALQGATGMSNISGQTLNQNMQTNQLLAGYGNQQQQQEQQRLSTLYQDFLNQQNDPYKKIGFMANTASAAPTANLGSTMYQAPPSTLNTLIGAGSVLGAAALKSANGGMVGRYAKGGLVRSRPQGLVALAIHSMA